MSAFSLGHNGGSITWDKITRCNNEGSGLGSMQGYGCIILLRRAKAVFANVIATTLVLPGVEMQKCKRLKQLG